MKKVQISAAIFAITIAGSQLYYLLGMSQWTTNDQPLTAVSYVLFFWILWGYSRVGDYILPLLNISTRVTRTLALTILVITFSVMLFASLISEVTRSAMFEFGVLNGAVMVCYLLMAMVSIFGDKWLGRTAKILKLGRNFPKNNE